MLCFFSARTFTLASSSPWKWAECLFGYSDVIEPHQEDHHPQQFMGCGELVSLLPCSSPVTVFFPTLMSHCCDCCCQPIVSSCRERNEHSVAHVLCITFQKTNKLQWYVMGGGNRIGEHVLCSHSSPFHRSLNLRQNDLMHV